MPMDDGEATVIGAAIGLIGAALGMIGGYIGGRAQARGTVEGVQLQLSGQRADTLWQAEIDACASFIDSCNRALFKLSQLRAIAEFTSEQEQQVSVYGIESRDELLRELRGIQDECTTREVALLLRMPSSSADNARAVGHALTVAANSMLQWCAAYMGQAEDEPECRRDAEARLVTYRQLLRQFTSTAQQRFSDPHPALGGAVPVRRSLFRRRR